MEDDLKVDIARGADMGRVFLGIIDRYHEDHPGLSQTQKDTMLTVSIKILLDDLKKNRHQLTEGI